MLVAEVMRILDFKYLQGVEPVDFAGNMDWGF